MTTKLEKIATLKKQYVTIKTGSDEIGYTELNAQDYETKIAEWADYELDKEAKIAEAEAAQAARTALLAKLGITADEAKLLLS